MSDLLRVTRSISTYLHSAGESRCPNEKLGIKLEFWITPAAGHYRNMLFVGLPSFMAIGAVLSRRA